MESQETSKKEFLTIEDVAQMLSFSISRIRYEMSRGSLPFIKIGRSVRFERKAVEEWVKNFGVINVQG